MDWANMLAETARSVTLVHRRAAFTAHESSVAQLHESSVRIVMESEVADLIGGNEGATHAEITHVKSGESQIVPASVVIPALGHIASLGPLTNWGLSITRRQIEVGTDMSTGRSTVYAAGDISGRARRSR